MSDSKYYIATCPDTGREFLQVRGRDGSLELPPELREEMFDYLEKLHKKTHPTAVVTPCGNISTLPFAWEDGPESLKQTLLRCLFEEFTANGGHFTSPDTDLWFKQLGDFSETTSDIFERLISPHHHTPPKFKQHHFYKAVLDDNTVVYHWLERFFGEGLADSASVLPGHDDYELGPISLRDLREEVSALKVERECPKAYAALTRWVGRDPASL